MNIALTNGHKPLGLLRRFLLLAGLFVASVELAHSSEAPALIDRPNADSGPTQISVGIWVADISNIDSAQQNFTAEVAVVLRWKDSRLAHTGKGIVRYPREQIWHPRVSIVNETNSVSRKIPDSVEVEPDGTVTYRQLYVGAFTQPLRLQSFPFDRQTFRVQLVAVRYQSNEVMFVPDQVWIQDGLKGAGGISPSVTLPDWTIEKWEVKPLVYALAPRHQYSSYAFEFTASRNVQHYTLESNPSPRPDRDDVVGRFLDRSSDLQLADQYRGDLDAYADCLSVRHR